MKKIGHLFRCSSSDSFNKRFIIFS